MRYLAVYKSSEKIKSFKFDGQRCLLVGSRITILKLYDSKQNFRIEKSESLHTRGEIKEVIIIKDENFAVFKDKNTIEIY